MILVGFYNFWVLGRSTREGGGLASLAPGWGRGVAAASVRASTHQLVLCNHLLVDTFESN